VADLGVKIAFKAEKYDHLQYDSWEFVLVSLP